MDKNNGREFSLPFCLFNSNNKINCMVFPRCGHKRLTARNRFYKRAVNFYNIFIVVAQRYSAEYFFMVKNAVKLINVNKASDIRF